MGKTILITGGAGGICSDICRGLAADGLNVVVADYAHDAAEKVGDLADARNASCVLAIIRDHGDAVGACADPARNIPAVGDAAPTDEADAIVSVADDGSAVVEARTNRAALERATVVEINAADPEACA